MKLLLGLFAVAMLFATAQHLRGLFRRRRALGQMYRGMAATSHPDADNLRDLEKLAKEE